MPPLAGPAIHRAGLAHEVTQRWLPRHESGSLNTRTSVPVERVAPESPHLSRARRRSSRSEVRVLRVGSAHEPLAVLVDMSNTTPPGGTPPNPSPKTEKPNKPRLPPFPAKTKVRYAGGRRIFADYIPYPILQPGMEVEIIETAGPYSVYIALGGTVRYTQVITLEDKSEWVVVGG